MSSLIMHKHLAVQLKNVSKIYRLHGSQGDQLIDVLRLQKFGFKTKTQAKEFAALNNISLDVARGHRVGIIGRNGAGKTTLLKLICGNFAPTHGEVKVKGEVQALMNVGLGFHPEYTGRENVEASLQYNGLSRIHYQQAIDGIIDFCELGDFLDQPFKTYSMGMQARLMFAAATAIQPDILIVDEVLGAGDAYFVSKSKKRVEKLVSSGCTMLLVSHSMQQVLELCDEVIWLDKGQIRMQGEAFLVVKAYEEFMHGSSELTTIPKVATSEKSMTFESSSSCEVNCKEQPAKNRLTLPNDILMQEPFFLPHSELPRLPKISSPLELNFVAAGGISRWNSELGLKLIGFSIVTERGISNTIISMRPAKFLLTLISEFEGEFHCRYGIILNDHMGNCVTRIFSPTDIFNTSVGNLRQIEIMLNPCQLGSGQYTIGISILESTNIEKINTARRYDLLSRSFNVNIEMPQSLAAIDATIIHSAEWKFN